MNITKIAVIVKRNFSEFYGIMLYRKMPSEQLTVKQYSVDKLIAIKEK